jgi:hypothetical protein
MPCNGKRHSPVPARPVTSVAHRWSMRALSCEFLRYCGNLLGVVMQLSRPGKRMGGKRALAVTRYNRNLVRSGSEDELARLAIQVHAAAHQTRRSSQAMTRVAAEVRCIADEWSDFR